MPICVREYEGLDAAGSAGQRLGEHPRRGRLEHGVTMRQPTPVEERQPRRDEHLGAAIEQCLSRRLNLARRGLATMLEVRLEFADRVSVEWCFELLANHQLICVVRAVQRPWKDKSQ